MDVSLSRPDSPTPADSCETSLSAHSLVYPHHPGRHDAASSVVPVSAGYEHSLRPCLAPPGAPQRRSVVLRGTMQLDVFSLVPHAYAWLTEQRPVAAVLGSELDLRLY